MAFENFNIQLSVDISEARSELKKFQSEAKARVAELQKQFDKLVLPRLDSPNSNKGIADIVKNVNTAIKRVNDLKKSIGDIGSPVMKPANTKNGRMQQIDIDLKNAKEARKTLKANIATPGASATLKQVESVIVNLLQEKRKLQSEVKGTVDEIAKVQSELKKLTSDPSVKAAIESERARIAKIRAERAAIFAKQKELMDKAQKEMASPEILKSIGKQVALLKSFTKAAVDNADSLRAKILTLKQEVAQATKANSPKKGELQNQLKSLLSELGRVQDVIEYSQDELETLRDKGVDLGQRRRMGSSRGSRTNTRSSDNPELARPSQIGDSRLDPKVREIATTIVDELRDAVSKGLNLKNMDLGGLTLKALQKINPGITGQKKIGIALPGTEKDTLALLKEDLSQALKLNDVDMASQIQDLIEEMSNLNASVTEWNQNEDSEDMESTSRTARGDALKGTRIERDFVAGPEAVGSIQQGDIDYAFLQKAENEFVKELMQMLNNLGGVKMKSLSNDSMKAEDNPEYALDIATADELKRAFEIALEVAKQIKSSQEQKGIKPSQMYRFGLAGRPENLFSSPFTEKESEEYSANSRLKTTEADVKLEGEKTKGLRALLYGILNEADLRRAKASDELIKKIQEAISNITFKKMFPMNSIPSGTDPDSLLILDSIKKLTATRTPKTDFNKAQLTSVLGRDSSLSKALLSIIQNVSRSMSFPEKVYKGYDPKTGSLLGELSPNTKAVAEISKTVSGLSDVEQEFLDLLEFVNQVSPNGTSLNPGYRTGRAAQEETNLGLNLEGVAYPTQTMFEQLFNAIPDQMKLNLPSGGDTSISLLGRGLAEQQAPVINILKELASTFKSIYGSEMKDTMHKSGKFNELGLPDDAGKQMTFLEAFINNVRGYYNELIQLNSMAPATMASKKEAVTGYWRTPGVPISQNVEDMLSGAGLGSDKPYSPKGVRQDIEDISRILEDLTQIPESGAFAALGQLGDAIKLLNRDDIANARAAVTRGSSFRKYTPEEQFLRSGLPTQISGAAGIDTLALNKKYGRSGSAGGGDFGIGMLGMQQLASQGIVDGINSETIKAVQQAVKNIIEGSVKGLMSKETGLKESGAELAKDVIDGFEGEMEIESPSKRMAKAGKDTVDGLEEGLFAGTARLDAAGKELAKSFHEGWSDEQKAQAVELIQKLEKENTPEAKARIQKGLTMMRSAPPQQSPAQVQNTGVKLSTEEEIQKRNEKRVAILDEIIKKEGEILLALDIESTGVTKNEAGQSTRNRVFGYSMVAGGKEESDEAGMLPGSRVVTPSMAGIAHGMVVPPKDLGKLFSPQAAEAIGLKQHGETNAVVLQNLIKRIEGLGYPAQNITGSEQEYVKQLEDIAFFLRKVVEEKIPLAIHNAQLSDITALGKEFAHYGITAPTGGQLKDAGLLVETQSFGKMFEGFLKDASGKLSLTVGNVYKQFTGKEMGPHLIPKTGDVPQLTDKSAVAHDPTIDTAATLVNAFSMRKTGGNLGMSGLDLFGKTVQMFGATWQKVSDAIWGKRKYDSKEPGKFVTGDINELQSFKRQAATRSGELQPIFVPNSAIGARPIPTPSPTPVPAPTPSVTPQGQDRMDEAQSNVDIEKERADLIDKLDKERQKREKEHQAKLLQWETDKIEELMSQVKNIASEIDKPSASGSQGMLTKEQLTKDLKRIKDEIAKKYATIPGLEDSVRRQLQIPKGVSADNWIGTPGGPAAGGVRTLFFAGPKPVNRKTKDEKAIEDRIKQLETKLKELGIDTGNAGEKTGRGPNTPIAAPLDQLTAAEEKLRASIIKAAENNLAEELVARLKKKLSDVEKSIKAGSVGKRGFRDASGQLTSAEVDVFKVPEGVLGVKQRVAPLSRMKSIKTQLAKELTVAQEKGRTETVAEITKLLEELDKSIKSGPVGKYNNGKDAYEIPDAYRKRGKQEKVTLSLGSPEDKNKAFTHSSNIDMEIAAKEKAGKQFSSSVKGQMQEEMRIMAQVEKYNRKMMDSWISGRYALYDVANTYQQFNKTLMQTVNKFKQAIQVFAQYETSFTSVERALQPLPDEFAGMRNEVVKLTNTLPVAFDELSRIETLGAQMGIKADGITNFTEQVTKFSAITGLASDTVAQKFGRISQLAKVPSEDFNKLGSAVAYAGVNAVATDEEILTLTENISAAANNSGWAADEIVGLATAMSSLGIAPEQARGVITRLFGDINRAVEGSGKPLQAYANHLGLTSTQAKELWKTDPQGFFKRMLDGLAKSKNTTLALDALNIRETREVSTLQKLSGNMEVYNQAMADALESYAAGSFLGDAYAKTQDNIAAKMEILSNKFKMLQDAIGGALAPVITPILDVISGLLDGLNAIAKNPVGRVAIQIAAGLLTMVAAFTAMKMVSMKATASLLAFRTAQISMSKIGQEGGGIAGFVKAITGAEKLIVRSNGRIEVTSRKAIKEMVKAGEIRLAKRGSAEDKALSRGIDPRRAGMAGSEAFYAEKDAMKQATLTSNEDTLATLSNTDAKKQNAMAANESAAASNSEANAKGISTMMTQQEINAIDAEILAKEQRLAVLASEKTVLAGQVGQTEGEIAAINARTIANEKETLAIEEQIAALQARKMAGTGGTGTGPEVVKQVGMMGSLAQKMGAVFSAFSIGSVVVTAVLGVVASINEAIEATKVKLEDAGGGLASFREAIYKDTTAYRDGGEAYSTYTSKIVNNKKVLKDWAQGLQVATNANTPLTDAVSTTTEEVKKQTLALSTNSAQWLANAAMQDDVVQGMFKKYFERGSDLGILAEQAGTKISDLIIAALSKPGTGAVDYLKSAFDMLAIPNSNEVYNDLMNIANSLDSTTKSGVEYSKMIKAIQGSMDQFNSDDMNTQLENTKEKIYTLTNYVADLSTLMSNAFTIKFGLTESTDKLETSWKGVGDRLQDARKEMEAINQEISSMTADKNLLEYQLNIALKYGDTLRADKIRAELATKQSEIEGKVVDLNKATQDASTSLVGINPGAIQNRETMRAMVNDYQTQLASLANQYSKYTGKTQKADRARIQQEVKNLKADFKARAMALGFSEEELKPYLDTFADWKTLVEKLPNQLTVKVVADAGMRAWLEWWAANKDGNGNVVVVQGNGNPDASDQNPQPAPPNIPPIPTPPSLSQQQVSQDTQIMQSSGRLGSNEAWQKDFNSYRKLRLRGLGEFKGAFDRQTADRLFGSNKAKMNAWDTWYSKYSQSNQKMTNWNSNMQSLDEVIQAGFESNKNDYKLNSSAYTTDIDSSINAQANIATQFKKLSKPLQDAITWIKASSSLFGQDKSNYDSALNNYKKAKKDMGLDENKSWDKIVSENGPSGTGQKVFNGKNIYQYLKPFKDKYQDTWTILNNNAKIGQQHRSVLMKYNPDLLSQFFEPYSEYWKGNTTIPASLGDLKQYASGGYVSGKGTATSDSIPAMLSNGEFVLSADTVNRIGIKELNALNSGVLRLAKGGVANAPSGKNWWDIFVDPIVKWWQKYSQKKVSGITDENHGIVNRIKASDKLSNANLDAKLNRVGTTVSDGYTYGYGSRKNTKSSNTKPKPFKIPGVAGLTGGFLGGGSGLMDRANMADGGYVRGPGTGTSDSIPLWASNGEYMAKAKAVNYYGLDFMNAINQMQVPRYYPGMSQGSQTASGSIMVELSPDALAQIMSLSRRPINLYSDDRQIATSANRGNMLLAMRGSN